MATELWRLHDDLGLPKDIHKLYIKTDAKVVVNILTTHYTMTDSYYPCSVLISYCTDILQLFKKPTSTISTAKDFNLWMFW